MVIDFHTHTFPTKIASKAIARLEGMSGTKAVASGLYEDLLDSMMDSGIDLSVVAPVATTPNADSINQKNLEIQKNVEGKLLFLGAIHPLTPVSYVDSIKELGFKGVKMHPDFQEYVADDKAVFPLYERLVENNLFLLVHAGEDVSYMGSGRSNPSRIKNIATNFPHLKIIAAHFGGYLLWDDVLEHLSGLENIYLDSAYCCDSISKDKALKLIEVFGSNKILLGSDSPWKTQSDSVAFIKSLGLSSADEALVLGGNAKRLLNL